MSSRIYSTNYIVLSKINTLIWFSKNVLESIESSNEFNKDKLNKQLDTISSYSAIGYKLSTKHFKKDTSNDIKEKISHHFNKIISCIKNIRDDLVDKNDITNFSISELKRIIRIAIELYFIYNITQVKNKKIRCYFRNG